MTFVKNLLAAIGAYVAFIFLLGTVTGDFRLYYGPDFSKSGMCERATQERPI